MTDLIPKILELLKLSTKHIAVLCVVSGLLIMFPSEWLIKLHIEGIKSEYGVFIGVAFLVSATLLLLEGILWIWNKIKISWLRKKLSQTALEELQKLGSQEIAVLREFYIHNQSTLQLPVSHPLIASLIEKGILEQVGSLGEYSIIGPLLSLTISSVAKPYITHKLLNLPKGKATEQEKLWIQSHRPSFMGELDRRNIRLGNI